MPEISVGGYAAHYEDTVRPMARTILFLHGAGGSHRVFRDQWAGLKGVARLVIPDLPGHGFSGGKPHESIGGYAAWVADFAREAELPPVILAGHSMGGAVALQAALDGRLRPEALVLLGTGAKLTVSPSVFEGIERRFREFSPELVSWMTARGAPPELLAEVTQDLLSTRAETFLADFSACDGFDLRGRLAALRIPTLVVTGDEDRLTPLKYGEFLAANIPGAVLKIIRGAGHLVMLERPEEVNAVIRAFVHSLD